MSERMKSQLEQELIEGYQEMAELNQELSEAGIFVDNEALSVYEENLTECE